MFETFVITVRLRVRLFELLRKPSQGCTLLETEGLSRIAELSEDYKPERDLSIEFVQVHLLKRMTPPPLPRNFHFLVQRFRHPLRLYRAPVCTASFLPPDAGVSHRN
jgi:hypothetical protein